MLKHCRVAAQSRGGVAGRKAPPAQASAQPSDLGVKEHVCKGVLEPGCEQREQDWRASRKGPLQPFRWGPKGAGRYWGRAAIGGFEGHKPGVWGTEAAACTSDGRREF